MKAWCLEAAFLTTKQTKEITSSEISSSFACLKPALQELVLVADVYSILCRQGLKIVILLCACSCKNMLNLLLRFSEAFLLETERGSQ